MSDLLQLNSPAFLNLLSPELADQICAAANIVKYTDGQLIHSRGEAKPGLSIVRSGAAHVGVYGSDGTFVMTGLLGPGECFGEFTLFTDLPRTHDVSAAGNTEIYQLSEPAFRRIYRQHPELSHIMMSASLMRTHLLLEMLDALRRLPLLERAAKIILTMSYTSGSEHTIVCRQTDLAYTLGVTRVSLAKVLKQLSDLQLIRLGYGKIHLPAREQLEQWVDEHCDTTPLNWAKG